MKTYIDLFETYKNLFLGSKRLKNRFRRYWGTTTVAGVEVYNQKLQVWPGTDATNVKKILKMFGAYESIKNGDFQGITSYYLWLNPNKTTGLSTVVDEIWINQVNALIPNNVEFEININYTDTSVPTKFVGWGKEQIAEYVDENYSEILQSSYVECRADTMTQEAFGLYMLLDDGVNFQMTVAEAMVTPIAYGATVNGVTTYKSGISVTYKVKQVSPLQLEDPMAVAMLAETDVNRVNKLNAVLELEVDQPVDNDVDWIASNDARTDELWYKGYLRTAIEDSSYVRSKRFAEILGASIDTGYTKKKTKWWKKVLAIVLVVAAVVLAIPTGGVSIGTLGTFAVNLGIAALILTGVQYVIAQGGDTGFAQYIGKLVQVVSIVSTVAGVSAFIQNFAKEAAKNAIVEALKEGAYGKAIGLAGEAVVGAVKGAFADVAEKAAAVAKDASLGGVLDVIGTKISSIGMKVVNALMDMRVNTARDDLRDAEALVEQSQKELMELTDREMNIGVEDIKYYTKPLTMDNVVFEVDYLYEGTLMNIGRPSFYPTGLNIIDK